MDLRARVLLVAVAALPPSPRALAAPAQDGAELEALVAAERREADLLRRRGRLREAQRRLGELVRDDTADAESRVLLALCRFERGENELALDEAQRAFEDALGGDQRPVAARCARELAELQLVVGRYDAALATLEAARTVLAPETDPRDAWIRGRVSLATGERRAAEDAFGLGARVDGELEWDGLLARGRCERALGQLERASQTFVAADRAATAGEGTEPDVLVALGDLYFESEREVQAPGMRSAGGLYREALEVHPTHPGALLGLFELHRYNRRRTSRSPEEILGDLLTANPNSVDGLLAKASADLEVGQLPSVRETLARLGELAPERRERRTLQAALAWVEHRREECHELLAALLRRGPEDSRPEREVGRHLLELWRFEEGLPFLRQAVERDPSDYEAWTQLGRALANTGAEEEALEAFENADTAARGRRDAWRENTERVLQRMQREHVVESYGELGFSWRPDAAEVMRTYFLPFYREARAELAERYGYTPGPSTIEVFRRHEDFSVRSVGFPGFPALGVCFGPVVTAVCPLSELRGTFSWARTGFHEFSHVVHLGLSHNRCPRWITEGLATWEEVQRNPAWSRNMRRELVDALANEDLIPVRELNRAFRGPRILFGYYQGGLLCEMLIDRYGFAPMVHLLRAFDRGLDVDQAVGEVFDTTPEAIDADFHRFVSERVAALAVEPRWQPEYVRRLRARLERGAPAEPEARAAWAEDWTTVAWASWQGGRRIDAEEALRRLDAAGEHPTRARFLRGEMALAADDRAGARALWKEAVDRGGRDYRAIVALAALTEEAGGGDEAASAEAERLYLLAEATFPGFDDVALSAELRLVRLYEARGEEESAQRARERWLAWNAGDYERRVQVARWHVENGRLERAAQLFAEANEVDPFRRSLHEDWGRAALELGRHEEALRELRVAALVPPELDADQPGPLADTQRAELLALEARCLKALGREDEAHEAVERALELDADCVGARDVF